MVSTAPDPTSDKLLFEDIHHTLGLFRENLLIASCDKTSALIMCIDRLGAVSEFSRILLIVPTTPGHNPNARPTKRIQTQQWEAAEESSLSVAIKPCQVR